MNKTYHIREWLKFYQENQTDTYGEDTTEWETPSDLAQVWYDNEEPEDDEDKEQTVWFRAGVYLEYMEELGL